MWEDFQALIKMGARRRLDRIARYGNRSRLVALRNNVQIGGATEHIERIVWEMQMATSARPEFLPWAVLLAPLGLTLAGVFIGQQLDLNNIARFVPPGLSLVLGVVLAIVSIWRSVARGRIWSVENLAGVGLIAYAIIETLNEVTLTSLLWFGDTQSLLTSVGWLSPIILGSVWLPRRRAWLLGLGCWAILFAATAAMAFDAEWGEWSSIGWFVRTL